MSLFERLPRPADDAAAAGRLTPLDGLRAAAVLAVVVFHARGALLPGGYVGVDLFFVLSGFLITGILVREHERSGRVALGRFYRRRALRLLPALVVVCAVVAAALAVLPHAPERAATYRGVVTALTYTSSPVAALHPLSLGWMLPSWSLSVEEYFYLVWPLALVLALRGHRPGLWVGLATMAAVAYRIGAAVGTDWTIQRLGYGADTRTEQLMVGAALAFLVRRVRVPAPLGYGAAAVLLLFAVAPSRLTGPVYRDGGSSLVAVAAALLIGAVVAHPGSALSRALAVRPLRWVGCRSYGIYLWNLPVIGLVGALPVPGSLHLPVNVVLSLLVPALSYRFVETPFLRMKDRHVHNRSAGNASVPDTTVPTVWSRAAQVSSPPAQR